MIKSSLPPILHSDIGIDNIELRLLVAADLEFLQRPFPRTSRVAGRDAIRLGGAFRLPTFRLFRGGR